MRSTTKPKVQVGPKPQVDPPEPFLAPKNGQKDPRTQIGHFQPLASGNYQRPPAQAQKVFPSIQGNDSPSPMYSVPRIQEWCIYGIIYHYAPILLSNLMVMALGPNYAISKEVFSVIQSCNPWWLPEDNSRTPATWPCRSWVVLSFRIIPRVV
ncbi:hypothetical protein O181_131658 [Austropuccinia psidii MF-1]|uniref:Uncharacterized protein n=1 Tax=Austropuccinia psidii MF-1 TaxID=1389203 RepID=A0A9Q3L0Y1_9BASI|nr:hypothetical protein [Austropuccinia psidii MF-1]